MIEFTCANCGNIFLDYPSNRIKGKNGLCCSVKCKGEYQTKLANARSMSLISAVCTVCGTEKPSSEFYKERGRLQTKCKDCVKSIRKVYYDQHQEAVNVNVRAYHAIHPGRLYHGPTCNYAQAKVNRELKAGRIIKPDKCQECGKPNRLHAHHWHGYDNPLDVIWLCPSCHHAAHGRGPKSRQLSSMPAGSIDEAMEGG